MALCGMLAYWTGRDPERMDRIFRSSALMREKWNREDYSKNTIQMAILNCTSIYDPKGKRDFIENLDRFRMDHRWEDTDCFYLYGAFIRLAQTHGRYIQDEGISLYASTRMLNLLSNIVRFDSKDYIKISRTWKKLQEMGLIRELEKGGPMGNGKTSRYLITKPFDLFSPTERNTLVFEPYLPNNKNVFPYVGRNKSNPIEPSDLDPIQKVTWIPGLKKKQRMIIEQIRYGRNDPELLSEYLWMRKNNLKNQTMKPILDSGLVEEKDGRYFVSEESIDSAFIGSGGKANLDQYLGEIYKDGQQYKEEGEDANLKRSMEKIESHLRGETPFDELSRWERDQASGRRLSGLSKRKNQGDGLLTSGRRDVSMTGGNDG